MTESTTTTTTTTTSIDETLNSSNELIEFFKSIKLTIQEKRENLDRSLFEGIEKKFVDSVYNPKEKVEIVTAKKMKTSPEYAIHEITHSLEEMSKIFGQAIECKYKDENLCFGYSSKKDKDKKIEITFSGGSLQPFSFYEQLEDFYALDQFTHGQFSVSCYDDREGEELATRIKTAMDNCFDVFLWRIENWFEKPFLALQENVMELSQEELKEKIEANAKAIAKTVKARHDLERKEPETKHRLRQFAHNLKRAFGALAGKDPDKVYSARN